MVNRTGAEMDAIYSGWLGTASAIREYLIRSGRSKAVTCSHIRQEHSRQREEQEKGTGQTVFDLFSLGQNRQGSEGKEMRPVR